MLNHGIYKEICKIEKSPCRSGKDSPIISCCCGGLAICQHPITPLQREVMSHL